FGVVSGEARVLEMTRDVEYEDELFLLFGLAGGLRGTIDKGDGGSVTSLFRGCRPSCSTDPQGRRNQGTDGCSAQQSTHGHLQFLNFAFPWERPQGLSLNSQCRRNDCRKSFWIYATHSKQIRGPVIGCLPNGDALSVSPLVRKLLS